MFESILDTLKIVTPSFAVFLPITDWTSACSSFNQFCLIYFKEKVSLTDKIGAALDWPQFLF